MCVFLFFFGVKFGATHLSIIILDNQDRVRERYTLALTAFTPAAESVGGDNSGPAQAGGDRPEALLWGSVKQEYRSLLATTASFLQTHSFSEPCPSPSSSAAAAGSVGTGDERGEMRPNVFKDEDGCRSSNDDDGNGRDDWSFSVTQKCLRTFRGFRPTPRHFRRAHQTRTACMVTACIRSGTQTWARYNSISTWRRLISNLFIYFSFFFSFSFSVIIIAMPILVPFFLYILLLASKSSDCMN